MEKIKLTSFSPGAGCGCKISPAILSKILSTGNPNINFPDEEIKKRLLVGNETSDDAAVYDLGNGQAVISTTDFFMPICDDAYDFGRIASANAISDVYAMGGKPLMAISVLGWPLEKLPAEEASRVLEGSRAVCAQAGIPLAGGHSIDSLEPIFGLAVTGLVDIRNLKKNNTARTGDSIFLTKPLGVGILSTAQKKGLLKTGHETIARDSMIRLNDIGYLLGQNTGVHAMTDVTGFGLLGHLLEICKGSHLGARIWFDNISVFPEIYEYIENKCIPGGTQRNWKSYGQWVTGISELQRNILCDPQTNGGLLITGDEILIRKTLDEAGLQVSKIGEMVNPDPATVIRID